MLLVKRHLFDKWGAFRELTIDAHPSGGGGSAEDYQEIMEQVK